MTIFGAEKVLGTEDLSRGRLSVQFEPLASEADGRETSSTEIRPPQAVWLLVEGKTRGRTGYRVAENGGSPLK